MDPHQNRSENWRQKFIALLIDYWIVTLAGTAVALLVMLVGSALRFPPMPNVVGLAILCSVPLSYVAYFAYFKLLRKQRTPGARIVGLPPYS